MRHFGLTSRAASGAQSQPGSYFAQDNILRDPNPNSYPLPQASLHRQFDHVQKAQTRRDPREFVIVVFLSLLFAVPLILIGVILRFR